MKEFEFFKESPYFQLTRDIGERTTFFFLRKTEVGTEKAYLFIPNSLEFDIEVEFYFESVSLATDSFDSLYANWFKEIITSAQEKYNQITRLRKIVGGKI